LQAITNKYNFLFFKAYKLIYFDNNILINKKNKSSNVVIKQYWPQFLRN